jgi:tRNA(fMet)-specific endonuclease VapC
LELILDTNALSAIAEGEARVLEELGQAREVAIPVIVLGEYRFGIALSRRREEYERWLADVLATCSIMDITEATSAHYAALRLELRRAGTPIPTNDVWIAALCRQHGLAVLSQDRHFDLVKRIKRLGW